MSGDFLCAHNILILKRALLAAFAAICVVFSNKQTRAHILMSDLSIVRGIFFELKKL